MKFVIFVSQYHLDLQNKRCYFWKKQYKRHYLFPFIFKATHGLLTPVLYQPVTSQFKILNILR